MFFGAGRCAPPDLANQAASQLEAAVQNKCAKAVHGHPLAQQSSPGIRDGACRTLALRRRAIRLRPELVHQSVQIGSAPVFGEQAVTHFHDIGGVKADLLPGCGNAEIFTPVRATPD